MIYDVEKIIGEVAATGVTATQVAAQASEFSPYTSNYPALFNTFCAMPATELDKYIVDIVADCTEAQKSFRRSLSALLPALLEMEARYIKHPGRRTDTNELDGAPPTWYQYLESRGVNPGTFRKWKQRTGSMRSIEHIVKVSKEEANEECIARLVAKSKKRQDRVPEPRADEAIVVDALSALANLGYKRAEAKQAVEHALSADATLGNNFDGLLRAALARPSKVTPEEKDLEQLRYLAERSESLSKALRQVVSSKCSKYAGYAEYTRLMSAGQEIAGLVALLGVPKQQRLIKLL
jgi:hypothetical protein